MRLALALICMSAISASADGDPPPPRMIIGAGVGGPGIVCCNEAPLPVTLIGGLWFVEGMYRPSPDVPVLVRAALLRGEWDVEQVGGGSWVQLVVGGELRGCLGPGFCGILDANLGELNVYKLSQDAPGLYGPTQEPIPPRRGLTLGGRAGLDMGGRYVRVRLAFDIDRPVTGDFHVTQNRYQNDFGNEDAFELGLAVAF